MKGLYETLLSIPRLSEARFCSLMLLFVAGGCTSDPSGTDAAESSSPATDATSESVASGQGSGGTGLEDADSQAGSDDGSLASDDNFDGAEAGTDCVQRIFYADNDRDGFGDQSVAIRACYPPDGYAARAGDCDDFRNSCFPGASERCGNGRDENCDGSIDEGCLCDDGDQRACGSDVGQNRPGKQTCIDGAWGPCSEQVESDHENCDPLDDDCDSETDEVREKIEEDFNRRTEEALLQHFTYRDQSFALLETRCASQEQCDAAQPNCWTWFESLIQPRGPVPIPNEIVYQGSEFGGRHLFRLIDYDADSIVRCPDTTRLSLSLATWAVNSDGARQWTVGSSPWINRLDLFDIGDSDSLYYWYGHTNRKVAGALEDAPYRIGDLSPETFDPFWNHYALDEARAVDPDITDVYPKTQLWIDLAHYGNAVAQPLDRKWTVGAPACRVRFYQHPWVVNGHEVSEMAFVPQTPPLMCHPEDRAVVTAIPDSEPGVALKRWNYCAGAMSTESIDNCDNRFPMINPFKREPLVDEAGAHSTFGDAVRDNETNQPDVRVKLVWPSNMAADQTGPVEAYCEANIALCQNLTSAENLAQFKQDFGFDISNQDFSTNYMDPATIATRHRELLDDWTFRWKDVGPWLKPRVIPGFYLPVLVAATPETIPIDDTSSSQTVFCDGLTDAMDNSVRLLASDGSLVGSAKIWCGPRVPESATRTDTDEIARAYDMVPGAASNLSPGEGITYYSGEQVSSTLDRDTVSFDGFHPLYIPPHAPPGPARLRITAHLRTRDDSGELSDPFPVVRYFPVYIEKLDDTVVDTTARSLENLDAARPACWIGATKLSASGLPSTVDMLSDSDWPVGTYGVSDADDGDARGLSGYRRFLAARLMGGDEGPWFRRRKIQPDGSLEDRLYALFGDTKMVYNTSIYSGIYRGSTMAMYVPDLSSTTGEDHWWWSAGMAYSHTDTVCPVMLVEGIDFDTNGEVPLTEVPWESVRASGGNLNTGRYVARRPTDENPTYTWPRSVSGQQDYTSSIIRPRSFAVDDDWGVKQCRESGQETVWATSAFQFRSQEQNGDAYVWYSVATDWGSSGPPGISTFGERDPLTGFSTAGALHNYSQDPIPHWNSFLSRWSYQGGIDDLGRRVSWNCPTDQHGNCIEGTTRFVINAAVVVDLEQFRDDSLRDASGAPLDSGQGILIWHTGNMRQSPVYFSFVPEYDVEYPDRYLHFAGVDQDNQVKWTTDESKASPVIWDSVGELSAVVTRAGQDRVFDRFKVIYNINTLGQQGIIMRTATRPWGPFSPVIPLLDCNHMKWNMLNGESGSQTSSGSIVVQNPDWQVPGSGAVEEGKFKAGIYSCYGGYSHPDLWTFTDRSTTIRFHFSMAFNPYKAVFAQSHFQRP